MDSGSEAIQFNIGSPMVGQRNITGFTYGSCDATGKAGGGLSSFRTSTKGNSCGDSYDFGMLFFGVWVRRVLCARVLRCR